MKPLDGIDKKIVELLMEDAHRPIHEIGDKVGLTQTAVHKRIKKLKESGLIAGTRLAINHQALGYTTMAFVGIYLKEASRNYEAVQKLKKIPEVLECHYTTGNWSMLVKIICRNNEHLMNLLYTKIQSIEGVSRTETFISLNQQINREIMP